VTRCKAWMVGLALVGAATRVMADDSGFSRQFSACMDKSGGETQGMVECIDAEVKRQDVRLNKAYKAVMADLPVARRDELQGVQRLWLKFREANCRFYADPEGGSMARVEANHCFLSVTAARARELEGFGKP
jgi:uncharacterized protein YecT (DUF1311 family)